MAFREGRRPSYENSYAELLRRKGQEHEQAFLAALRDSGRSVVEVRLAANRDFEAGTRRTAEAMRAGADYVYQAVFFTNGWRGIADFLERVERPSALPLEDSKPVTSCALRRLQSVSIGRLGFFAHSSMGRRRASGRRTPAGGVATSATTSV